MSSQLASQRATCPTKYPTWKGLHQRCYAINRSRIGKRPIVEWRQKETFRRESNQARELIQTGNINFKYFCLETTKNYQKLLLTKFPKKKDSWQKPGVFGNTKRVVLGPRHHCQDLPFRALASHTLKDTRKPGKTPLSNHKRFLPDIHDLPKVDPLCNQPRAARCFKIKNRSPKSDNAYECRE